MATPISFNRPDVIIADNDCIIDKQNLRDIRKRALILLDNASDKAYKEFPINRRALLASIIKSLATENAICHVLATPSMATKENHNDLRETFKSRALDPNIASQLGIIARRIPLKFTCPDNYDWQTSEVYNNVKNCEDVVREYDKTNGVPATIYSAPIPATEAADYFADQTISVYYIDYAKNGLKMCREEDSFNESFNEINVFSIWPTLKYVMRLFAEETWSSWTLLKNCAGDENDQTYFADDLMFNFGMRVYVPVTISNGDGIKEQTLVISTIAAAANDPLSKLLPPNMPFYRFIGGEFAKKLLLEAKHNEWEIKRL